MCVRTGASSVAQSFRLSGYEPEHSAAVRPCGRAAVRPCGRAAVRPCGRAAVRPCGRAAVRPCGRAAVSVCVSSMWRKNTEANVPQFIVKYNNAYIKENNLRVA